MLSSVQKLLLIRNGVMYVEQGNEPVEESLLVAAELELAELGYVVSYRLRNRLRGLGAEKLAKLVRSVCQTLNDAAGGGANHRPLFRSFPLNIPKDTQQLWVKRVLTNYLQTEAQPCLFCGEIGTTHVLNPCRHVVCDRCFDGANYSACPVCEHHVDLSSPFFKALEQERPLASLRNVYFKRLDLLDDELFYAQQLFVSLCERNQPMSPNDVKAFTTLINAYGKKTLSWVPEKIPVRENVAWLFGSLLKTRPWQEIMPMAATYLTTATDVLRLIAAYSDADPSLIPETISLDIKKTSPLRVKSRWRQLIKTHSSIHYLPVEVKRFKVAKLSRALRRELLLVLESLSQEMLTEDMLRHASYWRWLGEFLHLFEYAKRFPKTATAFAFVRQSETQLALGLYQALSGKRYRKDAKGRMRFVGFYAELEKHVENNDVQGLSELLSNRPGELARRLDHLLRLEQKSHSGQGGYALNTFYQVISKVSTPVLLTLASHMAHRTYRWPVRVYFPKGNQFLAPASKDLREPLLVETTASLINRIELELLNRFSEKTTFNESVIDDALREIVVPFNERTSSATAIDLTRGSWLSMFSDISKASPKESGFQEKRMRLFAHWCEPPGNHSTDLDLAVAFFDEKWRFVSECTYYHLCCEINGKQVAVHSGDYQDAPFPDGASEFIDLDRDVAVNSGIRYAVMLVYKYWGLPFSALERGFAGVMLQEPSAVEKSAVFDPRSVEHRFQLSGDQGSFAPLVADLADNRIFWLDASHEGNLAYNNVANSEKAVQRISSDVMHYFNLGIRPNMFQLAAMHAAARTRQVWVRSQHHVVRYSRKDDESAWNFYRRIVDAKNEEAFSEQPTFEAPILAAVMNDNFELPDGSLSYSLMRKRWSHATKVSDFIV